MKCMSEGIPLIMNYTFYKQMVLNVNVYQCIILCKTLRINNIDYDFRLIQNMQ